MEMKLDSEVKLSEQSAFLVRCNCLPWVCPCVWEPMDFEHGFRFCCNLTKRQNVQHQDQKAGITVHTQQFPLRAEERSCFCHSFTNTLYGFKDGPHLIHPPTTLSSLFRHRAGSQERRTAWRSSLQLSEINHTSDEEQMARMRSSGPTWKTQLCFKNLLLHEELPLGEDGNKTKRDTKTQTLTHNRTTQNQKDMQKYTTTINTTI